MDIRIDIYSTILCVFLSYIDIVKIMDNKQVHFDCTKNTLPQNWTNNNATAYYNREFWKRPPCEYGYKNPSKETADKFNPVTNETNKWTKGCNQRRNLSNDCNCDTPKKWNIINNNCCGYTSVPTTIDPNCCNDVSIVYRMVNEEKDCDNIVEFRIPFNGSKEKYLARNFSPEFIYANRFQCATVPVYNQLQNNIIDNNRQEEFTVSDQAALTKRGIKNAFFAKQLIEDGKLIHDKQSINIPMNICGRSCYYYFGDCTGSDITGLMPQENNKYYF